MSKVNLDLMSLDLRSHLVFIKDQIEWCEGCVIGKEEDGKNICIRDYCNLEVAKGWLDMFIEIEKKLGCPLEVVFKALKEELEYIANSERIVGMLSHIYYSIGGYWMGEFVPKSYILGDSERLTRRIPLKDYGKTWWLKENGNE